MNNQAKRLNVEGNNGNGDVLNGGDVVLPNVEVQAPTVPYQPLPHGRDQQWKYDYRRQMQEIVPRLFLGPYTAASKSQLEYLKGHGITHIMCVRHLSERNVIRPVHEGHFQYTVEMGDEYSFSLIPLCNQVIEYINQVLASGARILVHGNTGINRAAALVVAYVMANYGVSLKKALKHVQSKRYAANPCDWFMLQLREYEAVYQAMHDVTREIPESTTPKRGVEEMNDFVQEGTTTLIMDENRY